MKLSKLVVFLLFQEEQFWQKKFGSNFQIEFISEENLLNFAKKVFVQIKKISGSSALERISL